MALLVSTILSVSAFILFAVATTAVVSLPWGAEPLPSWLRPFFQRQGGRLRLVVSLVWGSGMVLLSQVVSVAALIYSVEREAVAVLPPIAEFAAAAGWSVYLFRAYAARP